MAINQDIELVKSVIGIQCTDRELDAAHTALSRLVEALPRWRDVSEITDEIKNAPGRILIGFVSDGTVGMKGEFCVRSVYWDHEFHSGWDDENDCPEYKGAWTDHAVKSFGYEETWSYEPQVWMPASLPEVEKESEI